MSSTRHFSQGFGTASSSPFSMTADHWLVVGPIAAALALAAMLIWFAS